MTATIPAVLVRMSNTLRGMVFSSQEKLIEWVVRCDTGIVGPIGQPDHPRGAVTLCRKTPTGAQWRVSVRLKVRQACLPVEVESCDAMSCHMFDRMLRPDGGEIAGSAGLERRDAHAPSEWDRDYVL